jgi:DNA-binding transcriptional MerR regulator
MAVKNESVQSKLLKNGGSPAKMVYKIEEVSRLTKVDIKTIDTWEQEFPFLRAGKAGGGQRFFRPKDVEVIKRVRELLEEKALTMAGIKRRVEEEFELRPSTPVHPDKLKKALYDVRDELQDIVSSIKKETKKA